MWGEKTVERDPESKIESPLFVALTVLSFSKGVFFFHLCGCAATFWTKQLLLNEY